MSRLSLMPHAVERYRERWAPHLTLRQAREELRRLSEGARPEKTKTRGGQELWVANDETRKILFVVKRDRHTRERICVTVLPEGAMDDGSKDDFEEFLQYQEEHEQTMRETELMRARADGHECQACSNAVATRFAVRRRERLCTPCYEKALEKDPHKIALGRCPLFSDWLKKTPKERQEILDANPPPSVKNVRAEIQSKAVVSIIDRPEWRAADVFRRLYSGCSWFVDVQPSEMSGGKKILLVSTTRMLESHESRFLRDFMGMPVRLDVLGVGEVSVRQAANKGSAQ